MSNEHVPLSLGQHLAIALIPSSVPALMLLISLGLAILIGDLPDCYEQIAGGALLITYIKELFPKVMEQGDAAVAKLAPKTGDVKTAKVVGTIIMVLSIGAAVVFQDWAQGFPGMLPSGEDEEAPKYTPASTIAYYIGFFVDGVVLAYDDEPVRCDLSLVKKMVMSLVFAIDNFLDGFGLVPVMKEAFPDDWVVGFCLFSVCVIAGGVCTALLLTYLPTPIFHLSFLSFATTFILIGAIQLMSHGLNTFVMTGVGLVWIVLFVGDLSEGGGEEEEQETHLHRKQHAKFKDKVTKNKNISSGKWSGVTTTASLTERLFHPRKK